MAQQETSRAVTNKVLQPLYIYGRTLQVAVREAGRPSVTDNEGKPIDDHELYEVTPKVIRRIK